MYYRPRRRFTIFKDKNDILSDATFSLPGDPISVNKHESCQNNTDKNQDTTDIGDESFFDPSDIDIFSMDLHSVVRSTSRRKPLPKFSDVSQTGHTTSLLQPRISNNNTVRLENSEIKSQENTWNSSIHLSEFEQPPRSTSTPNEGLFESSISLFSTPQRQTPLTKRPQGYSVPLFKFDSKSFDPSLSGSLHDTNESFSNDSTDDRLRSPLAYKAKANDLKEQMNHIADKMKGSMIIKNDSLMETDDILDIDKLDSSAPESSLDTGAVSVDMIDAQDISTPLSILKKTKHHNIKRKKTVRIKDRVEMIFDADTKRPQLNSYHGTPTNKRKRRVKHRVDPSTDYQNFKKLCGDEKDPLDIVLHR